MQRRNSLIATAIAVLLATAAWAEDPPPAAILEDNAADLLKLLTNPTGDPGEGHVDEAQVFSGKQSIRIVPLQRFNNRVPGWGYRIREKPEAGEYRYLRFAWKADGGNGIMLQLHDEKDWRIRYTAGKDMHGWGTKYVSDKVPQQWTIVTIDLFADHGVQTITGIALTNFDASSAWFDHIYFARTREELDRIDATGFREKALPALTEAEFATLWTGLGSDDAKVNYNAVWRLVAANEQAVKLMRAQLAGALDFAGAAKIKTWIEQLDDESFERREAAMARLAEHIGEARPLLERVFDKKTTSEEVRWRAAMLRRIDGGDVRRERAKTNMRRVLENIGTEGAKRLLEEL